MRVARARWFSVVIATMVWSNVWSGGVLAQDTAIPFRPACELLTTDAVSAVLGVDVIPEDAMPYAWCSYVNDARPVAVIGLSLSRPLVLHRMGLSGATDVTVGGLPALSSPGGGNGESARVYVGLPDDGILMVEVEADAGVVGPETAARALAEAILVTGPLTAHATPMSTAEPIGPAGSLCELVTLDELRQITGQRFADGKLDTNRAHCDYRAKDRKALVSLSIGTADLGVLRSKDTRNLKASDREAVFSPATKLLLVDLGAGQTLGVKVQSAGKGAKAKAIAETAMGRIIPGPITCPLISTDVVEGATGLVLQPIAMEAHRACWFVTPDEQTGLVLYVSAERPDLPTARRLIKNSYPDLPDPTHLEVSGHPSAFSTGASGTVLGVDLDGLRGLDDRVLVIGLLGTHSSVTDPLAALESVATQVLDGI